MKQAVARAALVGAAAWAFIANPSWLGGSASTGGTTLTDASGALTVLDDDNPRPSPSAEQSDEPLGNPPPVPETGGPYDFIFTQRDGETPVAYDPCRPIHIVVNERTAPPNGDEILADAVERMRDATGLHIVIDGTTTEAPSGAREAYQPDRYGDRWAPVLIAWTDDREDPALAGDTAGRAGSNPLEVDGDGLVYVTGQVTLDGPHLSLAMRTTGGYDIGLAVVLHELGHLLGLDHVEDRTQIMDGSTARPTNIEMGTGDRIGLAKLGSGDCFDGV